MDLTGPLSSESEMSFPALLPADSTHATGPWAYLRETAGQLRRPGAGPEPAWGLSRHTIEWPSLLLLLAFLSDLFLPQPMFKTRPHSPA